MQQRGRRFVFGGVVMAAVALPAAAVAHAPPIRLGRYAGKTNQGEVIRFSLVKGACDASRPPYHLQKRAVCFHGSLYAVGSYYPRVKEKCSNATIYTDPLYVASNRLAVPRSGSLSFSQRGLGSTLTPNGSLSKYSISVRGGLVTGKLRQTESYDSGAGPVYCDSHTVTFTAKRVG